MYWKGDDESSWRVCEGGDAALRILSARPYLRGDWLNRAVLAEASVSGGSRSRGEGATPPHPDPAPRPASRTSAVVKVGLKSGHDDSVYGLSKSKYVSLAFLLRL